MLFPNVNDGDTLVFALPPDKQTKQLLSLMNVKVVVKKIPPDACKREILVSVPPASGLQDVLRELSSGAPGETIVAKPDCSQQLWLCGGFALRSVTWAEDFFEELRRGEHPLCIIEGPRVGLRSATEEIIKITRRAEKLGKEPTGFPKAYLSPKELMSELLRISPATKYVISCHMKGFGVPKEDREQYERFPEVLKVIGRTDSAANQKYLSGLIRKLYPQ